MIRFVDFLLHFLNFLYVSLLAMFLTPKIAFCKLYPVQLTCKHFNCLFVLRYLRTRSGVLMRFLFLFSHFFFRKLVLVLLLLCKRIWRVSSASRLREYVHYPERVHFRGWNPTDESARRSKQSREQNLTQLAEQPKPKSCRADNRFGVWGSVGSGVQYWLQQYNVTN